jgi:hypothetical protein
MEATPEGLRQAFYHRRARIRLPNEKLHATLHAIVEAQIALGDETPACRIALCLIGDGLDPHDAIHAIGMVLAKSPVRSRGFLMCGIP